MISALTGWMRKPVVSVRIPRTPRLSSHRPAPDRFMNRPRRLIFTMDEAKMLLRMLPGVGFSPVSAVSRAMTA